MSLEQCKIKQKLIPDEQSNHHISGNKTSTLNALGFCLYQANCKALYSRESKGEHGVPLRDQQSALALLLELWGEGGGCRHDRDNRLQQGAGADRGLMSAPLLPFMRRIQDIPTAKPVTMSRWDEVSEAG